MTGIRLYNPANKVFAGGVYRNHPVCQPVCPSVYISWSATPSYGWTELM